MTSGPIRRLLIANRGEIAIRIARAAGELGIATTAIHPADDALSLHVTAADTSVCLPGSGPAAYLDIAGVIAAAREAECDAVHPGYGFLSESAEFASACADAGIVFVGPNAEALALFGDKGKAKRLAEQVGIPVVGGCDGSDAAALSRLVAGIAPGSRLLVKAVAGGGGRGIRLVENPDDLPRAIADAGAEALASFGSDTVIVERFVERARHVEVQVLADQSGAVAVVGERDCTLQRRNQKLIEFAPAPNLHPELRRRVLEMAGRLMAGAPYCGLGTVEFLVDLDADHSAPSAIAFIEVNPRLQVEHTVTEEVFGVDLLKISLRVASGATLAELNLSNVAEPRGIAMQLRINAESMGADGSPRASAGKIAAWEMPGGPGIRIDGAGYVGMEPNPRYDPLLLKLIIRADDFPTVLARGRRALADLVLEGIDTNAGLLGAVLAAEAFAEYQIDTRWLERESAELLAKPRESRRVREPALDNPERPPSSLGEDTEIVSAPLTGVVVSLDVESGQHIAAGQQVAVLEALKMQHVVTCSGSGVVRKILAQVGAVLAEGTPILLFEPVEVPDQEALTSAAPDLGLPRADVVELEERLAFTLDENRPDALARRRRTGQRTARENIGALFDPASFVEYGQLAIATGRRGTTEELMRATPGDGIVTGIGTVNAVDFGEEAAKCAGLAYDFTVIAGTQGRINHAKTDRLIDVVDRMRMPLVFFCEGGGGRPGDGSVGRGTTGLAGESFHHFARLSGKAPRIGIASGRCFAGNAVFLGCCDLVIATENAKIGLGGPAMIEGGGLGEFTPDEIGPIDVQWTNGVADVRVADEVAAASTARAILSYFQGNLPGGECADQRLLRHVVPENRLRVFDIRNGIELLADTASWIELRGGYAPGMITGLLRIDGKPMGVIANDCRYLSGAIDADGCDKAARFMQLCDAFGLPILTLCDTPGFMVGPEAEMTGTVRKGGRMFVVAAALNVPMFTVVVRKGYGLGAMAMAGGSLHASPMTVAWPTGEFGGMGLEGAVRLGHKRELDEIADPTEREARYQELVAALYANGKAVAVAQFIDIDAVIDPAETRQWLRRGLASMPRPSGGGRYIDCW